MTESRQFDEALFRQALQHFDSGNYIDFDRLCNSLLKNDPNHPLLNHLHALSCRSLGRLQDAEESILRALTRSVDHPAILNSYGLILLDLGKAQKAISILTKALKIDPSSAAINANMGHAQRASNLLPESEASYREALRLDPTCADALIQLALLLRNENRLVELGHSLSPPTGKFHNDPGLAMVQGLIALDQDMLADSEAAFRHALKRLPQSAILWNNLGLALSKQGKQEDARKAYETSIHIDPNLFEARLNVTDLMKYDSPAIAREYLIDVIETQPNNEAAHDLLGFTWFMDKDFDRAINYFTQALSINSSFEQAAAHRAGAHFLKGDLSSAWPDYNRKYGKNGLSSSPASEDRPLWNLKIPSEDPVLIWTNEGPGDEILQLGFISDIRSHLHKLIIATSDRIVPIASRSFPEAMCIDVESLRQDSVEIPQLTTQCPAMQVAPLLWKSTHDCPQRKPYLIANEGEALGLRKKYQKHSKGNLLVGISWRSTNAKFGSRKSLDLADLIPVLEIPDVTFINLQYGDTKAEISALPAEIRQKIICDEKIDSLADIDLFTSQVRALDLVITTSNTTAHIAGALGCKTWTLVPRVGPGWLWYWFDNRLDSPWYSEMRLYRQCPDDGWAKPLSEIRKHLSVFIKEFQSLTGN